MGDLDKEYESSLKSIETENYIDRVFYRPIGFVIARSLKGTGITPNMITILSIFVGGAVGFLFYHDTIGYAIAGILMLMFANILDCVDGQLARLTGIKSKIGRILDGMAGDIWFTIIYFGFAFRLAAQYGTYLLFIPAVLSGFSHLIQANITDYYKTLHLYFISKEKGVEFQSVEQVSTAEKKMKFGITKFFYVLYRGYTMFQVNSTPRLQQLLHSLHEKYGDDIPEDIRLNFRKQSMKLMKLIDLMTFNGRTIVMFIVVLFFPIWFYFIYEFVVLNIVLIVAIKKHERMCTSFYNC